MQCGLWRGSQAVSYIWFKTSRSFTNCTLIYQVRCARVKCARVWGAKRNGANSDSKHGLSFWSFLEQVRTGNSSSVTRQMRIIISNLTFCHYSLLHKKQVSHGYWPCRWMNLSFLSASSALTEKGIMADEKVRWVKEHKVPSNHMIVVLERVLRENFIIHLRSQRQEHIL